MNDGDWVEAVREQAAAAQAQVKPINGPSPTKETKFKNEGRHGQKMVGAAQRSR